MMDESMKLPSGYRFNPFEKELITYYLKPKVLGQKLPCNVVEERQLYGPDANPWQVFDPENYSWILSEVTPGKFEKTAYVFVNLTKKAAVERKNKVARDNYIKKAGCGTWDGQTKRSEIRDSNGDLIGDKRLLVFEINEVSNLDLSKVGYWKMHEYHLCGINEDIINSTNTVLCKITLDYSKNPPIKSRHKINQDHPIKSSSKPHKKNTNMDIVSSPSTVNNVDGNQRAVTTQTRRDFDNYMVKEEKVNIVDGNQGAINTQTRHDFDNYTVKKEKGSTVDNVDGNQGAVTTQTRRDFNNYKIKEEKGSTVNIVDGNQRAITTQTRRDFDSDFDNYRVKEEKELTVNNVDGNQGAVTTQTRHKFDNYRVKEEKGSTVNIVDGNQGAVTTQTPRDFDNYRVKEEKGFSGTNIVETFDGVECMSSNYGKKNTLVTTSSPLEVNNGHLKQASSNLLRPARFDNEYASYLKPKEETPPEDTASNLRKRKIEVETLYARTKKFCP